jgi:hypothetical protein
LYRGRSVACEKYKGGSGAAPTPYAGVYPARRAQLGNGAADAAFILAQCVGKGGVVRIAAPGFVVCECVDQGHGQQLGAVGKASIGQNRALPCPSIELPISDYGRA